MHMGYYITVAYILNLVSIFDFQLYQCSVLFTNSNSVSQYMAYYVNLVLHSLAMSSGPIDLILSVS